MLPISVRRIPPHHPWVCTVVGVQVKAMNESDVVYHNSRRKHDQTWHSICGSTKVVLIDPVHVSWLAYNASLYSTAHTCKDFFLQMRTQWQLKHGQCVFSPCSNYMGKEEEYGASQDISRTVYFSTFWNTDNYIALIMTNCKAASWTRFTISGFWCSLNCLVVEPPRAEQTPKCSNMLWCAEHWRTIFSRTYKSHHLVPVLD